MQSIVKTVILCGMQNTPLRIYRCDATHVQLDTGENHCDVLLETQNNNALYASKITENEIMVIVGEQKIGSEKVLTRPVTVSNQGQLRFVLKE